MSRWSLCALGLGLAACARGPNVGSELPLQRVVVYRNGVGYFERAGRVKRAEVSFQMRQRLVGDFLASLAVIERGGSSVQSASFPLELEDAKQRASSDDDNEEGDDDNSCHRHHPCKPKPAPDAPTSESMRKVLLHLDGKQHDLLIGYLSETPVWRPSYRVVIEADGHAALQAWGIVQNLSGEDWNNVALSLVAGAPLAFQSTLGTPVIPTRPIVSDQGEVVQVVPGAVTSIDRSGGGGSVDRYGPEAGYGAAAPAPPPAEPMAEEAEKDEDASPAGSVASAANLRAKKEIGAADKRRAAAAPMAPPPPPRPMPIVRENPSGPRNLSDLAAVALEAGSTRYDMPFRVSVPNQSATMVLLTSQQVPGEAVLLFAPEGGAPESQTHPFRVARITNSTPGLLERGPIAVFESGSFLGQGLLDPLPAKATATVPFALERSVLVERDQRSDEQGARLFRIEAGRLFIERDWVNQAIYKIDHGADKASKLLVKHTRIPGTRLIKPPPGTEDNAGSGIALVPVVLKPHSKTELTVEERRAAQQETDWLGTLADQAVRGYLADKRARPELVTSLTAAWSVRDNLRRALDELDKLQHERDELERASDETRRNLRAVEKNPQAADLRQKLTKRLAEASTRLDAITKRAIELKMSSDELQIRFRDATRELKLDAPLPTES